MGTTPEWVERLLPENSVKVESSNQVNIKTLLPKDSDDFAIEILSHSLH